MSLDRLVAKLEDLFFRNRRPVLMTLTGFTLVMAVFAVQLRMEAGFEKQIPVGHEYTNTFETYKADLFGANRITVVVKARQGKSIWSVDGLSRLYKVTQAVSFLPNVDKLGVQSLWTPNCFVNEITEEGFRADPVIPGTVTPAALTPDVIAGFSGSNGMAFLLAVMWARSSVASAALPVTCLGRRSTSIRWQSVPPVTMSSPRSCKVAASTRALSCNAFW